MNRKKTLLLSSILVLSAFGCASTGDNEDVTSTNAELSSAVNVTCQSYDRYRSCDVDTRGGRIIGAHVTYEYSSGACRDGSSFGFGEDYLWVDHGCRAEFEVRVRTPDGGAEIVVFEHDGFGGRSMTLTGDTQNFAPLGFNDITSSVIVRRGTWSLCEHAYFGGRCSSFGPGQYQSLSQLGFNDTISSARVDQYGGGGHGGGGGSEIIVFEHDNFGGRSMALTGDTQNFAPLGFNDITSSVIVRRGVWSLCEHAYYGGRCNSFGPGQYPSMNAFGMNDIVSSARSQ